MLPPHLDGVLVGKQTIDHSQGDHLLATGAFVGGHGRCIFNDFCQLIGWKQ